METSSGNPPVITVELQEKMSSTCTIILPTIQQYNDSRDPILGEQICMHLEILIQTLERLNVTDNLVDLFRRGLSLLQDICERDSQQVVNPVALCQVMDYNAGCAVIGRPRYVIQEELLEQLLDMNFNCNVIAKLLGVSLRTVRRRMEEYGLSIRSRYSTISDENLDQLVIHLKHYYPSSDYRIIHGILKSQGYRIQQQRVRNCMQRTDPSGAIIRWFDAIHRRKYYVQGPLSLWHLDGNHKLIR